MRLSHPTPEETTAAELRALAAILSGEMGLVPSCSAIHPDTARWLDALAIASQRREG